jgi:aryl-alcohol dehydrogenase-like predicted oxidoreductase
VRYIGHSNLAAWQIADAEYQAVLHGHPRFVSAQNEYNLAHRGVEHGVLPAVRHYGLGFLPYFPLYNGLFTGKFSRSGGPGDSRIMRQRKHILDEAPWDALDAFQRFCDERDITMVQATFGWLLAQPGLTSVIAGATSAEQVVANAEAATAWSPTPDEVAEVSALFPA